MLRFLLVLLLLGGLWLGYDQLLAGDVEAGDPAAESVSAGGVVVGSAPAPEPAAAATPSTGSGPASAPASPPLVAGSAPAGDEVDGLIAALESADASAAARALALLPSRRGPQRARLARALEAAMARAEAPAVAGLLGPDNAFLHHEEGRRLARAALEKASRLPPEDAALGLTRLLEACMRGPIARRDAEPRAVIDEIWGAQRRALRKTVLNPAHMARARSYEVASGDALAPIARRFRELGYRVEAGTLAAFNRIDDPRRLRAGQVLKIPVEPIRTVIEKHSFLAAVYVGDVIFRLYWVGHGKDDRTPEATFTVVAKKERPDWYAPDGRVLPYGHPENVLGDYFVKFGHPSFTGFGAHGTSDPETIGTTASAGCIRMGDTDIADYFAIVPMGSEVEIRASR